MHYTEFRQKFQYSPLILTKGLAAVAGAQPQSVSNQIERWQDRGLVMKLKRGVFLLNDHDRRVNPSRHFIANQLYIPSYVSLEYALNFYGLIPEQVMDVTSVTTKKTAAFKNALGLFLYRHVKQQAFTGFKMIKEDSKNAVFIAEPEKAIVDFFYLNLNKTPSLDTNLFRNSYRFQNTQRLRCASLKRWAKLFDNAKLTKLIECFCEFIREERAHD